MSLISLRHYLLFFITGLLMVITAHAQFNENFNGPYDPENPSTPEGWTYATGDGTAKMKFLQMDGYASIRVDATSDKMNIWWALIRHRVQGINMQQLIRPDKELRVEARIRVSHAPSRVNLHFNHQRTTDFHSHLMEFDIPDTINWHTISMTTRDFETRTGDTINVQMALMDWGRQKYRVDIDYIKVDVVDSSAVQNDMGSKLPYHPVVASPGTFDQHVKVDQDAVIDQKYPEKNFNDWSAFDEAGEIRILTVSNTRIVILRWDLEAYKGKKISGPGLLELTTYSLERSPQYHKDFGMVRVSEILEGDTGWEQEIVTLASFCRDKPLSDVINSQMIIDNDVTAGRGNKTLFTISQPVLQRMIDGRTQGIAIRPLGSVVATFYATEYNDGIFSATLHFNYR